MAYKVIGMLRQGGLGKDLTGYLSLLNYNPSPVGVVRYMNESERQIYKIQIINGFICNSKGQKITTTSSNNMWIFVMDSLGAVYSAPKLEVHHHSSFLSGHPVAAAGNWYVDDGVVKSINNSSGHYCPARDFLEQLMTELRKNKVNLNSVKTAFGLSSEEITVKNKNIHMVNGKLETVIDYLDPKAVKKIKIGEHYNGQFQRLYTPDKPKWQWF